MKKIKIDIGFGGEEDYKKLNRILSGEDFAGKFNEDIKKEHPYLFNDRDNTKIIHITIKNKHDIDEILKIADKKIRLPDNPALLLSLKWNFPRKKYNDSAMWACLSGFFYNQKTRIVADHSNHFVVSDNIVNPVASEATDKIIAYINEANKEYMKENKKKIPRKKPTLTEKLDKAKQIAAEKNAPADTDATKKRKKQEIE